MSFTVFLGNLPAWVTADDIRGWLSAENLVADAIKVIRNPETQESKGFAFIEAPNGEEMNAIIRRFDRAPLEDRLLRANPAQPPKPKSPSMGRPVGHGGSHPHAAGQHSGPHSSHSSQPASRPASQATPPPAVQSAEPGATQPPAAQTPERTPRRGKKSVKRGGGGPQSAFAEELAKAL